MPDHLPPEIIASIVGGYNGDPFAVLGPHPADLDGQPATTMRTFLPWASSVKVVTQDGTEHDAWRIHPDGLFEAIVQAAPDDGRWTMDDSNPSSIVHRPSSGAERPSYTLRATNYQGDTVDLLDPYSFAPLLTDFDLHLIGEGSHHRTYEKLGAHLRIVQSPKSEVQHQSRTLDVGPSTLDHVKGVHFAVWAPNAQRVSVIGNFNNWDPRVYPMRLHPAQGIWEIFIPNLPEGEAYKYHVKSRYQGYQAEKADPYGFYAELRPHTASVVTDLEGYTWGDGEWLANRPQRQALDAPISIYEVHLVQPQTRYSRIKYTKQYEITYICKNAQ